MRRGRRRLPAGCVSAARRSSGAGRADQHATRSPGDSAQECEAGGRDPGRAAASGGRASGEGATGEGGEGRAAGMVWSRRRTGSGLGRWGGR